MKNNPLIDVAAILICLLAVIVGGQYFINQKKENSLHQIEKRVELKEQARPKIDLSKFESAVKHTE